ncbi:hypothetical protein PLICRDRAFT_227984 [Plicaturopsis crispa FD-325 SS-3]|nr:hypothetical protein PLICRDRAFT_227984 [Plicaturopsis crispa FD-325 SS-3]
MIRQYQATPESYYPCFDSDAAPKDFRAVPGDVVCADCHSVGTPSVLFPFGFSRFVLVRNLAAEICGASGFLEDSARRFRLSSASSPKWTHPDVSCGLPGLIEQSLQYTQTFHAYNDKMALRKTKTCLSSKMEAFSRQPTAGQEVGVDGATERVLFSLL